MDFIFLSRQSSTSDRGTDPMLADQPDQGGPGDAVGGGQRAPAASRLLSNLAAAATSDSAAPLPPPPDDHLPALEDRLDRVGDVRMSIMGERLVLTYPILVLYVNSNALE